MEPPTIHSEFRERGRQTRRVRTRPWIKVAIGAAGFGAMLVLFYLIGKIFGYQFVISPFEMVPLCFPFVYFCIGLIELIGGRPFRHVAVGWMDLRGWQRGVIGTIIILSSLVLIIAGVGLVFTYIIR